MGLPEIWFFVIAALWIGFFFLEGFDFGVGILSRTLGRDEAERTQMLAAIGPVWDADEVWLITGGIAIFAAFPAWYAALFPAAYLPLLLVIIAIIVRAVAIEYRYKRPGERWRLVWDTSVSVASALLALLFGVFWAGIVHGIPLTADGQFVGNSLWSFINVYSLLGGLTLLTFSLAHGATFLALKTTGPVQVSNEQWAMRFDVVAGALMTAFAVWTYWAYSRSDTVALLLGVLAVLGMFIALVANWQRKPMIAFWAHGVAVAAFVLQMFVAIYPNVLPSSLNPADSLTVAGSAASEYSLTVITWVAAFALPLVIAYQAWSFWVFRKRISVQDAAASHY